MSGTGTGTPSTGSSYTPVVIGTGDYGDIRLALGFTTTDTTNVPATLIEGRAYLRWVEARVVEDIATYATILNTGDANYDAQRADTLKAGVIAWTASRIAALWFGARRGEEIIRHALGPASVQYREGPDWLKLAEQLADAAAADLFVVENWGVAAPRITLFARTGPTRKAADDETVVDVTTWRERLWPPVVKDRDYP